MRMLTVLLLASLTAHASNVDELKKVCYDTVEGTVFCTTDNLGNVQVFVYNAGWCPPCNSEVSQLSKEYKQFEGKKVTFASLSGEGFKKGSKPDQAFLQQWKAKHGIPFVVAGKHKDFGEAFGTTGFIPFSVIVDSKGNVVEKGNLEAIDILIKVKELLKETDEVINPKTYFDSLHGFFDVLLVNGVAPHHDPNEEPNPAFVTHYDDAPNQEEVYMPYCTKTSCKDTGGTFLHADTTVTKTAKGHHWMLKVDGKTKHFDWEAMEGGKILFRNHQFENTPGKPEVYESVLKRLPN